MQGTEKIKIVVPQGVKDGSKVRVAGKGEPGVQGGKAGDLYLIIHVAPHRCLKREGDDLLMGIPVTVGEAVAGGSITIPTIDGPLRLKVPPKSQAGQTLRLKGKGAVNTKTKQRGDLLVRLEVKVPQSEDESATEAARKLDEYYRKNVRADIRL
jgi:DnaJ-class molecular chaperone